MGLPVLLTILVSGCFIMSEVSAQSLTLDGDSCKEKFVYNGTGYEDCTLIDDQYQCEVDSGELKQCEPQQSPPPSPQSPPDCSRPTQAGCKCLEQWTHMGRMQTGCAIPDADPNGPWCLIEENSCEKGDPFGQQSSPQFDYCIEECGPQYKGIRELEGRDLDDCSVTQGYCLCEEQWAYRGDDYSGCANPDGDILGSWCVVQDDNICTPRGNLRTDFQQASSMMLLLFGLQDGSGSPSWDYCQPSCGPQNPPQNQLDIMGDSPSVSLSVMGVFDKQALPDNVLTNLPDLQDDQADAILNQQNDDSNVSISSFLGPFIEPVPSQADNLDTQQQSQTQEQLCYKTQNGCNCRRDGWNWDGNQDGIVGFYWGCAKTVDFDRPWCQITDASECESEPFDLTWDYCDDSCVPQNIGQCVASQNGCDCISPWMYDGVEQSGCTQPDAEAQFSWCVVDESSCDEGVGPEGRLNSGEVWDRCPSNC
eukprot:TRINITY_DN10887_c0_g1_i11.p1 TRINITY_DN10887_c0_g1~~TRINITY_DN10887_c0_g1_i11.p1  ORF type:complete len:478 (+),score=78.65 TRINITY_DN10887_c0_g1_i11:164-1597(+)